MALAEHRGLLYYYPHEKAVSYEPRAASQGGGPATQSPKLNARGLSILPLLLPCSQLIFIQR